MRTFFNTPKGTLALGEPLASGYRPLVEAKMNKLPRYVRRKQLKSGKAAYYWSPPTRARHQGCTMQSEALGEDFTAAVVKADALNRKLDAWRRECKARTAIPRVPNAPRKVLRSFADLGARPAIQGHILDWLC